MSKKKAEKSVAEEDKKTTAKGKKTAKNADSIENAADSTSKSGKTSAGKRKTGRTEFETIYCYSDEERVAAIERLSPNPEITRFKGLGEMNAIQLRETTMDPNTRRLVQLDLDDSHFTAGLLDKLLAKKRSADRKVWLEQKGNLADIAV